MIIAGVLATSTALARTSSTGDVQPLSASGDYRCFYGPGMQIWQDINKGGPSMILCGNHGYWDNLTDQVENLSGANWNDRISSFEIFNTSAGRTPHNWRLCTDANEGGICSATYQTSVYVSNVGSTLNDRISSIYDYP